MERMRKSARSVVRLGAIVFVGAMLISIGVYTVRVHTVRADASHLMTLDPSSSLSATLTSQSVIAGQDVVTNWTDSNGDTYTIAGPQGTVLYLGTDTNGVPYGKVSPPVISTTAITGDQAIAQYNASGLSLYQEALAVGFSSTEAQQIVSGQSNPDIISSACYKKHTSGVDVRGCDGQHLLSSNGARDWVIGNLTYSRADPLGSNGVKWYRVYVTYEGHTRLSHDPTTTITTPANVTVTASYGGHSASITQFVPQDSLGPFTPGIGGFGTIWQASPWYCQVTHAPSASVEDDAGGAPTDNYSIWWKVIWQTNVGCL
jgi:hypothetical protein